MLEKFETYQLAVRFHRLCRELKLPGYLKNQMLRASSSIALNLAEGSGKGTLADKRRFYLIALGSLRECQAVIDLAELKHGQLGELADSIGAMIYRLCYPKLD